MQVFVVPTAKNPQFLEKPERKKFPPGSSRSVKNEFLIFYKTLPFHRTRLSPPRRYEISHDSAVTNCTGARMKTQELHPWMFARAIRNRWGCFMAVTS